MGKRAKPHRTRRWKAPRPVWSVGKCAKPHRSWSAQNPVRKMHDHQAAETRVVRKAHSNWRMQIHVGKYSVGCPHPPGPRPVCTLTAPRPAGSRPIDTPAAAPHPPGPARASLERAKSALESSCTNYREKNARFAVVPSRMCEKRIGVEQPRFTWAFCTNNCLPDCWMCKSCIEIRGCNFM